MNQLLTTFAVALPAPIDLATSLALFSRHGADQLDHWDGQTLVRTLRVGDAIVPFICQAPDAVPARELHVTVADARYEASVAAVVAEMFIVPPAEAWAALLARDTALAALDRRYPHVRTIRQLDLFAALVRCISAQQVNLLWATTVRRRLAERFGTTHTIGDQTIRSLDVRAIAAASVEEIRALQWTTRKAEYLIISAQAVLDGSLDLVRLAALPSEAAIALMTRLRGIGTWSAEWILARTLGLPTVVAGDLGVRKAIGHLYFQGIMPSETQVRAATAHWGPAANAAQTLALHALAEGAFTKPPR